MKAKDAEKAASNLLIAPPWLVQRISLREKWDSPQTRKGVDRFFSFDYMGSSEFEWGALPTAMKTMRSIRNLIIREVTETISGSKVSCWFLGDELCLDIASIFFGVSAEEEYSPWRMKEPACLREEYFPRHSYSQRGFVGWWCIDGGSWPFWSDNDEKDRQQQMDNVRNGTKCGFPTKIKGLWAIFRTEDAADLWLRGMQDDDSEHRGVWTASRVGGMEVGDVSP